MRRQASTESEDVPAFGVEEEFLLVDGETRAVVASAPTVLKHAQEVLGEQVGVELFPSMVETRTRPLHSLESLGEELRWLRSAVARAAAEAGCRAVASGTAVVPAAARMEVTENARYQRMVTEYGPLVTGDQGAGVCGCHLHLEVAGRDEAVRLATHLRPWLPTLQAMAANSPFHERRDSGYASWRTMRWAQWPGVGPTPLFADAAAYDAMLDTLVDAGMLLDRKMVYWYARPSEHCPTVEIRVADVNADLDTVVLLAGLSRALAVVLLEEVRRGRPCPEVQDTVLRAAHWRSARDGLRGFGIDVATGRLRPAVDLVEQLLRRAAPGLEAAGDGQAARELWERLRATGGGAARQRAAFHRRGDLRDVVDAATLPREGD